MKKLTTLFATICLSVFSITGLVYDSSLHKNPTLWICFGGIGISVSLVVLMFNSFN